MPARTAAGGTGKIGDREVFGSTVYEVVEAQIGPAGNCYDTWRLFLVNKTTDTAQQLNPMLAGGAKSLGNPTLTFVTLPNGKPALVFRYFIFWRKQRNHASRRTYLRLSIPVISSTCALPKAAIRAACLYRHFLREQVD
jgi:hypothetical protein